jgi:tyrosyl-tRNA synthetase
MAVGNHLLRNVVDAITRQEVEELAENSEDKRAYVGYEPSGVLHLGHMLTANKLIELQEAGIETVILLADVHAYLNGKGTYDQIHETAARMREQFLAYGLDENSTEFVFGSEFQFDEEYHQDLHTLGLDVTLNRAQRAMAEIQSGEAVKVSHVVYPLMQALDIEYLDIDLAVGGLDQRKVHALHREVMPELGYRARPSIHTPILADLTTGIGKMSSSSNPVLNRDSVTISFEDSHDEIEQKIEQIFFPPERDPKFKDYYDSSKFDVNTSKIELYNPALQLFEFHIFPRFQQVTVERPEEYGGNVTYDTYDGLAADVEDGTLHPDDAKTALASHLNRLVEPGRNQLERF